MADETRYSILIVDDEKSNLDILNHILKTDYRIFIAKSGQSALKRVNQDKPDLILLDIIMPNMTGYDVLLALKQSDNTRQIPVIFITGLTSAADEEKGFRLGAADYITKPFNNSIVKARVKTHLQVVKQLRMIEKLCMIDALTDIPNRRSFNNHLDTEWAKSVQDSAHISLLTIDADNFKAYNDTFGHPQGDVLLQTLAKVIESSLTSPGALAARIGGEEFGVILANTSLEEAVSTAENIRRNVELTKIPSILGGFETSITISIGVSSICPKPHDKISEFVTKSDEALYAAKNSGRNKVCYQRRITAYP